MRKEPIDEVIARVRSLRDGLEECERLLLDLKGKAVVRSESTSQSTLLTVPGCAESWRPVPEWDDYEVSDLGRVRSWKQGGTPGGPGLRRDEPLILKQGISSPTAGTTVSFSRGGRRAGTQKTFQVARLVLEIFVGPCPSTVHVAFHKNSDSQDNRLANLEWKSRAEVSEFTWRTGRMTGMTGKRGRRR